MRRPALERLRRGQAGDTRRQHRRRAAWLAWVDRRICSIAIAFLEWLIHSRTTVPEAVDDFGLYEDE
jgi:hypothetical protein